MPKPPFSPPGISEGTPFKAALKELGFTQLDYANYAGVSRITVNKFATGKLKLPTLHVRLLEALQQLIKRPG